MQSTSPAEGWPPDPFRLRWLLVPECVAAPVAAQRLVVENSASSFRRTTQPRGAPSPTILSEGRLLASLLVCVPSGDPLSNWSAVRASIPNAFATYIVSDVGYGSSHTWVEEWGLDNHQQLAREMDIELKGGEAVKAVVTVFSPLAAPREMRWVSSDRYSYPYHFTP